MWNAGLRYESRSCAQWDEALLYAAMLLVVVICLHIGMGALTRIIYRPAIRAMGIGFYVRFVLAGSFLCFEILSNHATLFRLMTAFPDIWPQAPSYLSEGALPPHFLNHRIAALAILLWPVALEAIRLGVSTWRARCLPGGLSAGGVAAIAGSEHATSTLAMSDRGRGRSHDRLLVVAGSQTRADAGLDRRMSRRRTTLPGGLRRQRASLALVDAERAGSPGHLESHKRLNSQRAATGSWYSLGTAAHPGRSRPQDRPGHTVCAVGRLA